MPGGVGAETFFLLLEEPFERPPLRAMELTESAPPLDGNERTAVPGRPGVLETTGLLAAPGTLSQVERRQHGDQPM